jgi:demethylmenaquinone methyltransferase/2-methoxy-6-polyprenyl-1,4-benzoquinol methylase
VTESLPPEKQDWRRMRGMFAQVAPRYDFITRAFSYGMDPGWKRQAVAGASLPDDAVVLDLACGTGDFSRLVAAARPCAHRVACDLTLEMLDRVRRAGVHEAVCADAMRLPFPDSAFDAVFVGYGLRNFPSLARALAEIRRVTRPGGTLVSLDFFLPVNRLLRPLYLAWLYLQGAFWGLLLHARPRTYTYIPDSIRGFLTSPDFAAALDQCGFDAVRERSFVAGGIALHWAKRR